MLPQLQVVIKVSTCVGNPEPISCACNPEPISCAGNPEPIRFIKLCLSVNSTGSLNSSATLATPGTH